jgi:hypothetical protein
MEVVMQVLEQKVLARIVGGLYEASGGYGSESGSGGGDGGGYIDGPSGGLYDFAAIGIEGGPMAVVTISGTPSGVPVFDITPPVANYGPGEAPSEGQYLGQWVEAPSLSYAHTAFDGALIANAGRLAGTAAAAFIEGAITGAEVGWPSGPIGALASITVGSLVGVGTYLLLQHDHPTGTFKAVPANAINAP